MGFDLFQFLKRRHCSIDSLKQALVTELRLSEDDVLYAAGSLVEGIGNERSDLDLVLISDRSDFSFVYPNVIVMAMGAVTIDIAVVTQKLAQKHIYALNNFGLTEKDPRGAGEFNFKQLQFLHRLAHSTVLYGDKVYKKLQRDINVAHLAKQKFQNSLHELKCLTVDLSGLESEADWASMCIVAGMMTDHAIDALLAGFQLTNPSTKWRASLLDQLPPNWEYHLPGRLIGESAQSLFFRLRTAPPIMDRNSILAYCNEVCQFCRRVTTWGSARHVVNPVDIEMLSAVDMHGGELFPRLARGVFILYDDGNFIGFNLDRINPEIVQLMPFEASALHLFDGSGYRHGWFDIQSVRSIADRLGLVEHTV